MTDNRTQNPAPRRFARAGRIALAAALAVPALGLVAGLPAPGAALAQFGAYASGSSVADFYRARNGAPLWFAPAAGDSAARLLQLLATAQADRLNPNRYNLKALSRAMQAARSGSPGAAQRADMMLSQAFVTYAADLRHDPHAGIIYVDRELAPSAPLPAALLADAAAARSLPDYVQHMGWMNPVYGELRRALVGRLYTNEHQRQLVMLNLERARALPAGNQRYVVVNAAAQRLYMYENGQVVDSMRVVAGKPEAPTPMMNAFIRYAILNPYWNSPADITSRKLAPNVVKQGRAYLKAKGYEVLSDWSDNAHVIDPMTIDWKAVAAGRQIRMRQRPGPANSMGRMKFMFPNEQGIWLHDTPEKEVIDQAARLNSNGCVRLQDAPRLALWLFHRPLRSQGAAPEQKVPLAAPVPVYLTYLTAVPSGSSITYFDDLYGRDRAMLGRQRGG